MLWSNISYQLRSIIIFRFGQFSVTVRGEDLVESSSLTTHLCWLMNFSAKLVFSIILLCVASYFTDESTPLLCYEVLPLLNGTIKLINSHNYDMIKREQKKQLLIQSSFILLFYLHFSKHVLRLWFYFSSVSFGCFVLQRYNLIAEGVPQSFVLQKLFLNHLLIINILLKNYLLNFSSPIFLRTTTDVEMA